MTVYSELQYQRDRIIRSSGDFYTVVEVVGPDISHLEFHNVTSEERSIKLGDIARLRMLKAIGRGVENPVVIIWDAYPHSEAIDGVCLDLDDNTRTQHISKNSHVNYYVRQALNSDNYTIDGGSLAINEVDSEESKMAAEILETLTSEGRIRIAMACSDTTASEIHANFDPRKDFVGVGCLGFPSRYAQANDLPAVFNTAFFIFEEEDYQSPFSVLGDVYHLQVHRGEIVLPPIYRRSALLVNGDCEAQIRRVSLRDLRINCLGLWWDCSRFSHNEPSSHAIYTRHFGVAKSHRTYVYTPHCPGNVDLVVVGRSIVGARVDGRVEIPQSGFVISLPIGEVQGQSPGDFEVRYEFANSELDTVSEGLQCGPTLVEDGQISLTPETLSMEEFFQKKRVGGTIVDYGVVPTDYAPDIDRTRAARALIGVDYQNRIRIMAVEDVNKGMAEPESESSGTTLLEMASLARERGYRYALNLDGGGSTNIQFKFGHLVRVADRRGLPGVVYERMVPSVGTIRSM